eukprot:gene8244-7016_t
MAHASADTPRPPARARDADDRAADVASGTQVFREMREAARRTRKERRIRRRQLQREWEADCLPTERGVTKRLMGKPGIKLMSVLQLVDGSFSTGEDLLTNAREQARGRRADAQLRAETLEYLREYPGERVGPPLSVEEATSG